MASLSDKMFVSGLVPLIQSVHSELITVMSGTDAGKQFRAVIEIEPDIVLDAELGTDRRQKNILRFMGDVPSLASQDRIRTEDGRNWYIVDDPQDGYLSDDFEIKEIVNGKDS